MSLWERPVSTLLSAARFLCCSLVTPRWHTLHKVRRLSMSHSPPPSATGWMWSTCQNYSKIETNNFSVLTGISFLSSHSQMWQLKEQIDKMIHFTACYSSHQPYDLTNCFEGETASEHWQFRCIFSQIAWSKFFQRTPVSYQACFRIFYHPLFHCCCEGSVRTLLEQLCPLLQVFGCPVLPVTAGSGGERGSKCMWNKWIRSPQPEPAVMIFFHAKRMKFCLLDLILWRYKSGQ